MERKTYTMREAAQFTGLSVDSVRDAAKAGRIPAIKPGGKRLILKEPFDKMLRGETLASTAAQ